MRIVESDVPSICLAIFYNCKEGRFRSMEEYFPELALMHPNSNYSAYTWNISSTVARGKGEKDTIKLGNQLRLTILAFCEVI